MKIGIYRICGVGDAVQLTPLLQQIRHDRPEAEIWCFVSENAADVLKGAPWIDRLEPLSSAAVTPGARNPGLWRMWREIAAHEPFDVLVNLAGRWRNNLPSLLVRARVRCGMTTPGWKFPRLFTHSLRVPANPAQLRDHASALYLKVWRLLPGTEDSGFTCELPHLGQARVHERFELTRPYLCVAPGAGNFLNPTHIKQWPAPHYAELMQLALADGYAVSVLGGKDDMPADLIPEGTRNLLGRTSLDETASLIRHAAGFIGNDSGLFHLALGVKTPAVGFFGPTSPDLTGPFRAADRALVLHSELPCAPCLHTTCQLSEAEMRGVGRPPCMHSITPLSAWGRISDFLRSCENRHPSAAVPISATATALPSCA